MYSVSFIIRILHFRYWHVFCWQIDMKKHNLYLILLAVLVFVSCKKNDNVSNDIVPKVVMKKGKAIHIFKLTDSTYFYQGKDSTGYYTKSIHTFIDKDLTLYIDSQTYKAFYNIDTFTTKDSAGLSVFNKIGSSVSSTYIYQSILLRNDSIFIQRTVQDHGNYSSGHYITGRTK